MYIQNIHGMFVMEKKCNCQPSLKNDDSDVSVTVGKCNKGNDGVEDVAKYSIGKSR